MPRLAPHWLAVLSCTLAAVGAVTAEPNPIGLPPPKAATGQGSPVPSVATPPRPFP